MRFTLNLSFLSPQNYVPLAPVAEAAGFDNISMSDSWFFPRDASSLYPYNDDGSRSHFEHQPFLDVFTAVPAMAAVTNRVGFYPAVIKLPIRSPIKVAKLASSVSVLSGGRFALGVGSSPWPEEYEVMGVDWPSRGSRMDECIKIVRQLCTGDYVEFHGEHFDFPPIKMAPASDGPIKILVGGHVPAALRRAAALGDGWIAPATGMPIDAMESKLATLFEFRRENAVSDGAFEVHVSLDVAGGESEHDLRGRIDRLESLGVTDVRLALRYRAPLSDPEEQLAGFQDDISRFAELGLLGGTIAM